ncbi:MAG: helix-turn-helix domain-containing protein [Saprospiraceae bacterium]|nr:helix-turn-helix domain-containing protein [Saprospiraceae bacterium]
MIIKNEIEYKKAFVEMDKMLSEMGDDTEKITKAKALAEAIEAYEKLYYQFPVPKTLLGMVELKMYEMKLKRKDLAELLDVETARISEYLNGKRKINLEFAKKLHSKLGIDGNFILESL